MAKVYDLTHGKVSKLILSFYFPMLFTNLLQQIYNIADTAIVGKGLGDDAVAAFYYIMRRKQGVSEK